MCCKWLYSYLFNIEFVERFSVIILFQNSTLNPLE